MSLVVTAVFLYLLKLERFFFLYNVHFSAMKKVVLLLSLRLGSDGHHLTLCLFLTGFSFKTYN